MPSDRPLSPSPPRASSGNAGNAIIRDDSPPVVAAAAAASVWSSSSFNSTNLRTRSSSPSRRHILMSSGAPRHVGDVETDQDSQAESSSNSIIQTLHWSPTTPTHSEAVAVFDDKDIRSPTPTSHSSDATPSDLDDDGLDLPPPPPPLMSNSAKLGQSSSFEDVEMGDDDVKDTARVEEAAAAAHPAMDKRRQTFARLLLACGIVLAILAVVVPVTLNQKSSSNQESVNNINNEPDFDREDNNTDPIGGVPTAAPAASVVTPNNNTNTTNVTAPTASPPYNATGGGYITYDDDIVVVNVTDDAFGNATNVPGVGNGNTFVPIDGNATLVPTFIIMDDDNATSVPIITNDDDGGFNLTDDDGMDVDGSPPPAAAPSISPPPAGPSVSPPPAGVTSPPPVTSPVAPPPPPTTTTTSMPIVVPAPPVAPAPVMTPPVTAPVTAPTTTTTTPILDVLARVTDAATLRDATTPQGKAATWLQTTDELTGLSEAHILQRYAIVTLDYALTGTTAHANALVSECNWPGITCQNGTTNSDMLTVAQLNWYSDNLSGSVPSEIGVLNNLRRLDLGNNGLTGALPATLLDVTTLTELYLHQNQFSGSLSTGFAQLVNLEKVFLSDNALTGPFPTGLASRGGGASGARALRYLSVHGNQLRGPLPSDLNYRNMYFLDLSDNAFSGTIPTDWCDGNDSFNQLRLLYLDHNQLTGTVPACFPSLGNDRNEILHLNDNMLSGTMPGTFQLDNFMQSVELHNNNFAAIDDNICPLIVFLGGEMTNFRADCDVCPCNHWFCEAGRCYN